MIKIFGINNTKDMENSIRKYLSESTLKVSHIFYQFMVRGRILFTRGVYIYNKDFYLTGLLHRRIFKKLHMDANNYIDKTNIRKIMCDKNLLEDLRRECYSTMLRFELE